MLNLAAHTPNEWGLWARQHIGEMLLDHTHCEKKAASTALGLVFRYAHHGPLIRPLSELAREELEHFERCLGELERRKVAFRKQRPSPYAAQLMEAIREEEPGRVIDTLLCCSLIEARSCERMQLFAEALERAGETELARLYADLLASEARHHRTYVDLAEAVFAEASGAIRGTDVRTRLRELAAHEAEVMARAPSEPRLHNLPPALTTPHATAPHEAFP